MPKQTRSAGDFSILECFVVSTTTGSSLNWIHLKVISVGTFCIIGLTKIARIEFLPLDWIYQVMTVADNLEEAIPTHD